MIDESMLKFKKMFLLEANKILKREKRSFEIDAQNEHILNFIYAYFSNSNILENKFNGRLHKGLLIHGSFGVGKSIIFEVLEILYKKYHFKDFAVKNVNTLELMDETIRYLSNPILSQNDETLYKKYSKATVHFEDLGLERKIQHFGNSIELMDEYLLIRYNEFRRNGLKTHITTNLNLEALKKRYSPQLYDRIFEMFNILEMKGTSRRK
ncbi:hypothetical protein [Maribacter sp. MAR_2009_72]|uniref:hypothetical protein n=1 Tax=Maribacter sp. MAR_2009_72 TaxID=1250050 RepID=UPI00119BC679|nr:hypothetical protein [Maribacter sp. MAR_2009_72]TVZ13963.1 DNA replication protein DnaC [Maribacter sp. MAR_2009_72]